MRKKIPGSKHHRIQTRGKEIGFLLAVIENRMKTAMNEQDWAMIREQLKDAYRLAHANVKELTP